jgi:bidirectional [NiFe] hydrogenase diaphorase subunit
MKMNKIKFIFDGKNVTAKEGDTILDVAKAEGVYIPSLCHNSEVKDSGGSCRVCLVEAHNNGRMKLVTSCNYPVTEGLEVKTETDLVKRIRKGVLELMLARVPDSDIVQQMAKRDGIETPRFTPDEGENYRNKCIACGLCTSVCKDVVGVSAISMLGMGSSKKPGTAYLKASDVCIGCGACVYVCPTGSIQMEETLDYIKIWNKEFKMLKCKKCGRPFIPEDQVEFIIKNSGQKREFFDYCPDHR